MVSPRGHDASTDAATTVAKVSIEPGGICRPACKPGFVLSWFARQWRSFIWTGRCRPARAAYPGMITGRADPLPLLGLASGGVCRADGSPRRWCALTLRAEAPHRFTLTRECRAANAREFEQRIRLADAHPTPVALHSTLAGGILSVALSRPLAARAGTQTVLGGGRYPPPCPAKPGLSSARTKSPPPGSDRPADRQIPSLMYREGALQQKFTRRVNRRAAIPYTEIQ